jgi:hypothetical protein
MTIDDVPVWLRQSEIYRNFQEGEGEFQVNSDCVVSSSKIENLLDFRKVIQAYLFWIVDKIPKSVFQFVLVGNDYTEVKQMFSNYESLWEKLSMLQSIQLWNYSTVFSLIMDFASRGYTDCIEFCLSLVYDDGDRYELLYSDVYLKVIESDMEKHTQNQVMSELDKMGFFILHTAYIPFDSNVNHIESLIWLHQNGSPIEITTLCAIITKSDNRLIEEYLLYALNSGVELDRYIMNKACEYNNLKAVELLIKFNCPCDEKALMKAITNENLKIMRVLCDYGCPLTIRHMYKAGNHGKLKAIKFLIRRGCPWDETVIQLVQQLVARQDTLEHNQCLQYLINHQNMNELTDSEDEE